MNHEAAGPAPHVSRPQRLPGAIREVVGGVGQEAPCAKGVGSHALRLALRGQIAFDWQILPAWHSSIQEILGGFERVVIAERVLIDWES